MSSTRLSTGAAGASPFAVPQASGGARWRSVLVAALLVAVSAIGCGSGVASAPGGHGNGSSTCWSSAEGTRGSARATTGGLGPCPRAGRVEPGPVPDFAPMVGIVTHLELLYVEPDADHVLTDLLGPQHLIERRAPYALPTGAGGGPAAEADERLVWIRDYHPLWVRRRDGTLKVVRYLADTPYRSSYLPVARAPGRPLHGSYHYFVMPGRKLAGRWLRSETLPLLHENGNLVTTGTLTFVTDFLIEENTRASDDPRLVRAGYRPRREPEVLKLFARAIERPLRDLVVLPQMPGEGTGHVDTFLLALDRDTVMVPEIRQEALAGALHTAESLAVGRAAQAFLDEVAAVLTDFPIRVVRLPMLAPILIEEDSCGDSEFVVLSPANVLLVPVRPPATVLLPRFELRGFDPRLGRLDQAYRREWERFFSSRDWVPINVEATQLALNQGLLRCASYPIPR